MSASGPRRPHILYLHSHDTGRYVRPYGFGLDSPAYQRLAEEGVTFRQAFTTAPTCSPSRAGLLTGQSPHTAGMLGLAHRGFALHDPAQHLATTLRDHGYRTVLAGTQHVTTGDPRELGYDEVRTPDDLASATVADAAVAAIHDLAGDGPFFLDAGFVDTHRPFPDADPAGARYLRPPAPFPDSAETRLDMAGYQASLRLLDTAIGRVLDALDEAGIAGDTLVVCTTDHGIAFPAMKCHLTDHGTGVLLIMRGPGGFTGGRVLDALVSQVDLFPTLCDLLSIAPRAWLQGRSLLPLVRDETPAVNEEIFAEVTYHAAYEPQRAIRTARWTYVERFGDRALPVLPNTDDGRSRDFWLEHGWDQRPLAAVQLYDNVFDPAQVNNLAAAPAQADVVADLHARLRSWMERTSDPLLDGRVPLPAGATANDPASRSVRDDLLVAQADGSVTVVPNPVVRQE